MVRKADFDAAWKKIRENPRSKSLFAIESGSAGPISTILFSRVTALLGPNGAGKSRFLRGLNNAMLGRTIEKTFVNGAVGYHHGSVYSSHSTLSAPDTLNFDLFDVSQEVHEIWKHSNQSVLSELLDQHEELPLRREDLDLFRYVCRRSYTSFSVREIDVPTDPDIEDDAEDNIFPFFSVNCDGIKYDSRNMGLGELSACYAVWVMVRSKKNSVLLFDEPDAHLSHQSRLALIDVMAFQAASKSLSIIFSSHGTESLSRLDAKELLTLRRDSSGHELIRHSQDKREVIKRLGVEVEAKFIIMVEDVDAKELTRQMMNKFGGGTERYFDVQIVLGGDSEIRKLIEIFPHKTVVTSLLAILDGDKRTARKEDKIFFFPGSGDPVAEARSFIESSAENVRDLADMLGVDFHRTVEAIDASRHVDHHDFLSALVSALGISADVPTARTAVFSIWIRNHTVSKELEKLCRDVLQTMG